MGFFPLFVMCCLCCCCGIFFFFGICLFRGLFGDVRRYYGVVLMGMRMRRKRFSDLFFVSSSQVEGVERSRLHDEVLGFSIGTNCFMG